MDAGPALGRARPPGAAPPHRRRRPRARDLQPRLLRRGAGVSRHRRARTRVKQGQTPFSDLPRKIAKSGSDPNFRRFPMRQRKYHHNVYVIELDPAIFNIARFRNANPDRDLLKPAVYVGMTGLTPEERFAKHKAGIRANRYVQRSEEHTSELQSPCNLV